MVYNSICSVKAQEAVEPLKVFVSILPQAYFVKQVGGEYVNVQVLVGPGQSPHTYEPTPRQMTALAEARLYFSIGVPFERQLLGKISATFRNLEVVDTRRGVPLRAIEGEKHDGHDHAEAEDPHIWLSPRRVKIQADNICRALVAYDSTHASFYQRNLDIFNQQLDDIDREIMLKLALYKGSKFYAFHPSYGYFADDYGLVQVAVEIEGKEPGARQLAVLTDQARADGVKVIFVQPQFAVKTAETIAQAVGAKVVALDPLAEDYINNLKFMAEELARAFSEKEEE